MPAEDSVYESRYASPLGELVLQAGTRGLRYVGFARPSMGRLARPDAAPVRRDSGTDSDRSQRALDQAERELAEYFAGVRRHFSVPLDLAGTEFQLAVWKSLLEIPYGEIITYRELAATAGRPRAIRAAGAANGANPISIIVPCHRVAGSDGSLTGYAGGLAAKRSLIEVERSGLAMAPNLLRPASRFAAHRPGRRAG
jgi:methylated-DNA-[protein]-cysteine S-methyltransferase